MANFKMEQVHAGMVVADDVKDRSGRVLMRSGTELIDKHIKILKTWGVRYLAIVTDDEPVEITPVINIDPAKLVEATNSIASLFRHTDREHPAIKELSALCVQRLAQRLGSGNHGV